MKFLKALRGENEGRPPVWLMRQAGRYMPSYQKFRQKYSLLEMFHNPELITKITMLPVDELGVDAAILFSDILIPLEGLGFSLQYDHGAQVSPKHWTMEQLHAKKKHLQYPFISQAIAHLKQELQVPLIGFCGGPFTVASYLLEEKDHHLLKETKRWIYQNTDKFHELLSILTSVTIDYLKLQIQSGVDVIQIFDSWAGALALEEFRSFSLDYLNKILQAIKDVPVILFCRGACLFIDELIKASPAAISFDWHLPLHELAKKVPRHIALQGNLDPDCLKGPHEVIKTKLQTLLTSMQKETRFIVNLGHGVTQDTPQEAVRYMVGLIQES